MDSTSSVPRQENSPTATKQHHFDVYWPTNFGERSTAARELVSRTARSTAMSPPTTPSRAAGPSSTSPFSSKLLPTTVKRSPSSTFGGGCTNKRVGTMSNVWELSSTGMITLPGEEIQRVRHDLGEQVLLLQTRDGLAAGSIHLTGCDHDRLSGWRLNSEYFVKSAHFLKLRKGLMEGTLRSSLARLSQAEPASAWISHADKVDQGDIYMDSAYLLAWQPEYDIAVFRYAKPQQSHNKPSAYFSQLVDIDVILKCTTSANRSPPIADTVWSTGYNGSDTREWNQYWNENYDKETEEGRQIIIQSQHGNAVAAKDDRPPPPNFKEFMRPGRRTMTFGTQDQLYHADGARYGQHSLTGWFGRSGSMICAMEKPDKVAIFGIFAGGGMESSPKTGKSFEHNCFNHLTYFDEERIGWIKHVLDQGDRRDDEIQFPGHTTNWNNKPSVL